MLFGPVLSGPVLGMSVVSPGRADLYTAEFSMFVTGGFHYEYDFSFSLEFEDGAVEKHFMAENPEISVEFEDEVTPKCWGNRPRAIANWAEEEGIGPCD